MPHPTAANLDRAADLFRAYLRSRGLRMTPERLEILRVALHTPAHFDAEDLVARLRRRDRVVSRATAYRTLAILERCGILRRSLVGQGRARYESAVGRTHHDHLVCLACGRVEEFFDEETEAARERIAEKMGFRHIDHIFEIFGHCAACRGANGNEGES